MNGISKKKYKGDFHHSFEVFYAELQSACHRQVHSSISQQQPGFRQFCKAAKKTPCEEMFAFGKL